MPLARALLSIWLFVTPTWALERATRVVPAPIRERSIHYTWIADDPAGESCTLRATLRRGGEIPWSLRVQARAMVFSWSPDGRFLLFGIVEPSKEMVLYLLDASASRPRERNLLLERVERRVEAALPERESGSFASYHQVDFGRVEWLSARRCRLHYVSKFDRKAGEATLFLDLRAERPTLSIGNIVPLHS